MILSISGLKSCRYAESCIPILLQKLAFLKKNCGYIAQPVENTTLHVLAVVYKGIWSH